MKTSAISRKSFIAVAALALWPALGSASTLEQLISRFAIPADATYTANDWSALNSTPGVKWSSQGVQAGAVNFSRSGKASLDKHGPVDIFFGGARTMVMQGSVIVSEGSGRIFEQAQFDAVMRAQFSGETTLRKLRGVCPSDMNGISGSAVYEVVLKGRKPLYVLINTDSGGNSPNSRTSGFDISLQNESRWKCL